jgi:hypothetical protein
MRGVWLVLAAGFRHQWRSWVLLGLLIAVTSGFVLAAAAAGRRTNSAYPRYVASHGYDAIVYTVQPLPKLGPQDGVARVTPVRMPFGGQPGQSPTYLIVALAAGALIAANALAAVPAMSAARSRPGLLPRTE